MYIRGEYGLAHERTQAAIREAYEAGYLGKNVMGKEGFDFEVTFRRGAGAYIVGEETGLFNSLEGKRGNPRYKPPFPTNVGVWGLPTAINNVETLSAAPAIIENGAEWFQNLGHGEATGTKMYCLSGRVAKPGVHELPLGTTARELVYDYGGGVLDGRPLKGFKTGWRLIGGVGSGAPGRGAGTGFHGCAGNDYGHRRRGRIRRHGLHGGRGIPGRAVLRGGELRVLHTLPRRRAQPCTDMRADHARAGHHGRSGPAGGPGASMMASFCGLGQFAHQPVRGAVRAFRDEFEAHIRDRHCAAGVCQFSNNGRLA